MPKNSWAPVRLKVLVSRPKPVDPDAAPFLPWPLAAALAGVGAATAGWLLVAGVMLASWFTAMALSLPGMLTFGTQVWLLALGVPAPIGSAHLTIMPLGLTCLAIWLNARLGGIAVRQAFLAHPDATSLVRRLALAGPAAGIACVAFGGSVAIMLVVLGRLDAWLPACLGAAGIALIGLAWAGVRAIASELPPGTMLTRLRRGAAGALGAVLTLTATGAVVVGLAAAFGKTRIDALDTGLAPDGVGIAVLAVIAIAWWPNALVWAASWAVGGGFSVGLGSFVSLSGTQLGMLPSIPMLGALPAPGVAPPALAVWMLSGVVAGCVAAVCARSSAGPVERTVTSASAALVASGVFVGAAAASRGDLGTLRLIGLGPDLPGLLVIAPAVLVLSAALLSVVMWLLPARGGRASEADAETVVAAGARPTSDASELADP